MTVYSHSRIRCYKTCKRQFFLRYVEEIQPIQDIPAFKVGTDYHNKIEEILKTGRYEYTGDVTDAMAYAFRKYIYPNLPKIKMQNREDEEGEFVEHKFYGDVGDVRMVGFADAMGVDGVPIEHKSTSETLDARYRNRLNWDEQVMTYCLMFNSTKVRYTACKKPTIRLKKDESESDFVLRCLDWYDECPEERATTFMVYRSEKDLEKFKEQIQKIVSEIESCDHYYRNPYACGGWMRCQYESICLDYIPQTKLIGFDKK